MILLIPMSARKAEKFFGGLMNFRHFSRLVRFKVPCATRRKAEIEFLTPYIFCSFVSYPRRPLWMPLFLSIFFIKFSLNVLI